MKEQKDVKTLLVEARKHADFHMKIIQNQIPLTRPVLYQHLRQYVLCKYMLKDVETGTENFHDLTEISLARSMHVSKELVKEFDLARSCDGASSVMTKKVLLFMAIQKALDIEIPAEQSAKLETLTDFSDMIWEVMKRSDYWRPRIRE